MGLADSFAGVQYAREEQSGKKAAWRELCGIIRHLESEISRNGNKHALPLFEIADVLVRFDYVAGFTRSVANLEGLSQRLKKAIL
jgi:hypothetical protein